MLVVVLVLWKLSSPKVALRAVVGSDLERTVSIGRFQSLDSGHEREKHSNSRNEEMSRGRAKLLLSHG